jgi:tetratricopeptide (TPR) repeat protein
MTSRILLCVLLTSLLATPDAGAAGKLTKTVRDVQSLPETERSVAQAKTASKAEPRLTVDQFIGRQQARIQNISDRQIRYLQRLIQMAAPDDPQVPDYVFRLGDLLSEKHRFLNALVRGHDEPIFRAEQARDTARAAEERRQQEREQLQADDVLRKAVQHFVAVARYPRYPRMDEVLYRLGYLLDLAGRPDRAREVYHRLLKEHPQSRFVPDAFLSFADDFFAKGDMAQAFAFYSKVTRFPQSSVYGFALYKKAWSQANLGDHKAALGTFVELLAQCQAGKIGQAQRGPLEKETRRDLVRVYARTPNSDPDRAWEFFRRVGGPEASRMLQSLAEIYWEEGMASSSSRVYRKVMTLEPQSPSLCAWQDKVLRNTLSAGSEPDQIQEIQRLGTTYRYLQQLGSIKPDVIAECRARYHDASRELAFVLHKQAQRVKQLPTYQLAAAAYREFLGGFESEPASTEVAFYYAECLWQIATLSQSNQVLWREAAEQYTRVIHLDPRSPFVKEAAYAAVLAWQNVVYENDDDLRASHRRGS